VVMNFWAALILGAVAALVFLAVFTDAVNL
jgi:hypothetical protein